MITSAAAIFAASRDSAPGRLRGSSACGAASGRAPRCSPLPLRQRLVDQEDARIVFWFAASTIASSLRSSCPAR
jgi:hypothetical protein